MTMTLFKYGRIMAIRKKIDSKIESFIEKGGQVASDAEVKKEWMHYDLRIPTKWVKEIDEMKSMGQSRNAWFLEAIREKMKHDRSKDMG